MLKVLQCQSEVEWDEFILERDGHPLQLWGWGDVKTTHGWRAERLFLVEEGSDQPIGAAQVLVRTLPWPLRSFSYIPRGPVIEEEQLQAGLAALRLHVKQTIGSAILSVEPELVGAELGKGWKAARNTVIIGKTVVLDLKLSEDELMAAMSKKTRQYIRKSAKEEITIRQVKSREELAAFLEIYKATAQRANFALHDDDYYYDIFEKLGDHSPVFAAYEGDAPLAFVWLAMSQSVAFELYGGMTERGQELRANYTLKWHAIRTIKQWGVSRYDMNGLLNDGVSNFKLGFTDSPTEYIGTYDAPLSPFYTVWSSGLPLAKTIVRRLKSLRK